MEVIVATLNKKGGQFTRMTKTEKIALKRFKSTSVLYPR